MVETDSESRRIGPRDTNWVALYDAWIRGASAEHLADTYGLAITTVTQRCGWLDQHFPPGQPVRMIASFTRNLDAARTLLDSGEPLQAERSAKALIALMRAARTLEDWTMDRDKPAADAAPKPEAEAPIDHEELRTALERRLQYLLELELKRQGDTGGGSEGAAGSHENADEP